MPRSAQPEIVSFLKSYKLRVPNLAPVFHWLVRFGGLTSVELGAAANLKPERVRAILSRHPGRKEPAPLAGPLDAIESKLLNEPMIVIAREEVAEELGISAETDYVVIGKGRRADIGRFELEIERDYQEFIDKWELEDGLLRMRRHIRNLGRPQSVALIRLLARLRHYSSVFLLHMGRARLAIDQARRAMTLSSVALHDSDSLLDRERIADYALILSMAYLLRNLPEHSLAVLNVIEQIHKSLGTRMGGEYHRQRGTALMLLMQDDAAEQEFRNALVAMSAAGVTPTALLYGKRQSHLLHRPDWRGSFETMMTSNAGFAPGDLPYQMNVHWAVVTALASGDARITDDAFSFLRNRPHPRFGHQATIRLLLELTPRLGFTGERLARWCRFLMYSNAFRDE